VGGYLSVGLSIALISKRPLRPSGAGSRYTSRLVIPSSPTNNSRVTSSMSSVISSRMGGPNRRRSNSLSSAWIRFSLSSSSTSTSSLRVTRNSWCSRTSIPGNNSCTWLEMRSSMGIYRSRPLASSGSAMNRERIRGTLRRANWVLWVLGLRIRTERLSDKPEI